MEERIYYRGFYIDKIKTGYRICRCDNEDIHTHLKNLNPAKKLIDNVLAKRIPTKCRCYYLESHIRLSDDEEYKRKMQDCIAVKQQKGKKAHYFNPQKRGNN